MWRIELLKIPAQKVSPVHLLDSLPIVQLGYATGSVPTCPVYLWYAYWNSLHQLVQILISYSCLDYCAIWPSVIDNCSAMDLYSNIAIVKLHFVCSCELHVQVLVFKQSFYKSDRSSQTSSALECFFQLAGHVSSSNDFSVSTQGLTKGFKSG